MKRSLIYLGVVLAVAVIVFLIERPDLLNRGDASEEPIYPQYDARRVDRIEIGQLLSGVQLKREGNEWKVADLVTPMRKSLLEKEGKELPKPKWFKADRLAVGGALGVFGQFPRGVVVSTNAEMQGVYRVAGNVGLRVRLFDESGEKMVDVVIGKQSPDFSSNYLRVERSDTVTLTDRVIDAMFPTTVAHWRDRTIWSINPDTVEAVSVWRPKNSYDLVKHDDKWELVKPEEVKLDIEKVKGFIGHLSSLRAVGFASSDDPRTTFKHPSLKFKLQTKEGKTFSLDVGGSNNLGQHYARREGDNQTYLVTRINSLIPASWKAFQE